jgi:hypothetical protein
MWGGISLAEESAPAVGAHYLHETLRFHETLPPLFLCTEWKLLASPEDRTERNLVVVASDDSQGPASGPPGRSI